jgi:hypothetical protein
LVERAYRIVTLYFSRLDEADKVLKGSIKSGFLLFRETAARKLSGPKVIGEAFATDSFSGAGVIGTGTFLEMLFLFAVHESISFQELPEPPWVVNQYIIQE